MRIAYALIFAGATAASCNQSRRHPAGEVLRASSTPAATTATGMSSSPTPIRGDGLPPGEGFEPPVVVRMVTPEWPHTTQKRRIRKSTFRFEAVINEDGRIVGLRTLQAVDISPPFPELEIIARDAVMRSEYAPARLRNRPVPAYLTISLHFDFR